MKFSAPLICIPLALGFSVPSFAEESLPWYQVEIVVFSQQDLYHNEKHRTDLQLSYPKNWRVLTGSSIDQEQPETLQPTNPVSPEPNTVLEQDSLTATTERPYVSLSNKNFKLGGDEYALKRAPGYQVLLHQAWRQQGLGVDQSPWIIIAGGEAYGEHHELEGSVRLVLNRHLHFQADLWHTRFGAPTAVTPTNSTSVPADSSSPQPTANEMPSWPTLPVQPWRQNTLEENLTTDISQLHPSTPPAWSYQTPHFAVNDMVSLNQSTRLKLGELTYLDHPNMGVLVLVSRHQTGREE